MSRWERVTPFKGKRKTRFVVSFSRIMMGKKNPSNLAKLFCKLANVKLT